MAYNSVPTCEHHLPPPPQYSALSNHCGMGGDGGGEEGEEAQDIPLTYVDFVPKRLDEGGAFTTKEFERFDILMRRANDWLRRNGHLKAKMCESIELKKRTGEDNIDTERVTFYEYGEYHNKFVRALRLWLTSRDPDEPAGPQQIGFINFIPQCVHEGGYFSGPKFEQFGDALNRMNESLRRQPIQGRILNVETQDMKFHSWTGQVDADESFWYEEGKYGTYFLNIIRLFYEQGTPAYEEVGCADFVPDLVDEGGILSSPKYEKLEEAYARGREWLKLQRGVRLVNIQSIDYKLKSTWDGKPLDTHRTMYYERGEGYTHYIRIVRLCYTRCFVRETPVSVPQAISYKTFSPVQLTRDQAFSSPHYESMSETVARATAWLRVTGCRVISVETVPVRLYTGHQYGNPEQTYTWNHGDRNETWLYILRAYLDRPYSEPPPDQLPPVPEITSSDECDDCCTVS